MNILQHSCETNLRKVGIEVKNYTAKCGEMIYRHIKELIEKIPLKTIYSHDHVKQLLKVLIFF